MMSGEPIQNEATRLLLHAVSGVPMRLLEQARVLPRSANWLHFPWYAASKGGGAFVLGQRIYVSRERLDGPPLKLLLLLAHEVGHLPQAERFGWSAWGRTRFVVWAASQYLVSFVRHGRNAHRKASLEQEAQRGRWVLAELLRDSGDPKDHPVLEIIQRNDPVAMRAWLSAQAGAVAELHRVYAGW